MNKFIVALLIGSMAFYGCKKDSPVDPPPGEMNIEFDHRAGKEDLILNAMYYITDTGDTIKPSVLKYYVSDIELIREDGTVYHSNETVLVDEYDENSHHLTLKNVPAGSYVSFRFKINTAAASTDMQYADASPVMFKTEGKDKQGNNFKYWLGAFEVNLEKPADDSCEVSGDKECEMHLYVDILKLFSKIKIKEHLMVTVKGAEADSIQSNASTMFSINHIHNY